MEIRFRSILLAISFLTLTMPTTRLAAQSDEDESTNLIEPQIERVEFDESQIDSYDFELSIYGGVLAMEHFDTMFRKISSSRVPTVKATLGRQASRGSVGVRRCYQIASERWSITCSASVSTCCPGKHFSPIRLH
jgi:hypothetical protein